MLIRLFWDGATPNIEHFWATANRSELLGRVFFAARSSLGRDVLVVLRQEEAQPRHEKVGVNLTPCNELERLQDRSMQSIKAPQICWPHKSGREPFEILKVRRFEGVLAPQAPK